GVLKWLARSRIRDRVRLLYMPEGVKDPSELWCRNPDPATFATDLQKCMDAAEAWNDERHGAPSPEQTPQDDSLAGAPVPLRGFPIIEYEGGRLPDATTETEELLAKHDRKLFQRGDFLVRIGYNEEIETADGEKVRGARLIRVDKMHLQDRATAIID